MALFSNINDEVFGLKGPTHLANAVNWNNSYHRRSVAASLVNGVNILERDRQKKRRGERVLAPAWWESFDFKLAAELVDDDASVFGAIYAFQPQAYDYNNNSARYAPRYVVAFRGTLLKLESMIEDLRLDIKVVLSNLRNSPRYEHAIKAVQKTVRDAGGPANIWLAGHSLGSAIAMLTGKTMAKNNNFIETYLFNPPFPSVPVDLIKNPVVQLGIRLTRSVVIAGLSTAINQNPQDDLFAGLYQWTPLLFVNSNDVICSEYIGYFEHRKRMKEIGARKIEKLAGQNSVGSLFLNALGKESELPVHLLPSAYLITNQSDLRLEKSDLPRLSKMKEVASEFIKAHEIYQWWRPDLNCPIKSHIIKKEYLDRTTDTEA